MNFWVSLGTDEMDISIDSRHAAFGHSKSVWEMNGLSVKDECRIVWRMNLECSTLLIYSHKTKKLRFVAGLYESLRSTVAGMGVNPRRLTVKSSSNAESIFFHSFIRVAVMRQNLCIEITYLSCFHTGDGDGDVVMICWFFIAFIMQSFHW